MTLWYATILLLPTTQYFNLFLIHGIAPWARHQIYQVKIADIMRRAECFENKDRTKTMSKKLVLISIFAIFFAIIGYDIFLYADGISGNSITQVIIATTRDYPIIAWMIGFLMGYLTAHFYDPKEQGE